MTAKARLAKLERDAKPRFHEHIECIPFTGDTWAPTCLCSLEREGWPCVGSVAFKRQYVGVNLDML